MKVTFTDVHWRNSDDSDTFNIHAIQSIELDIDKSIVTIVGVAGTYKSAFCHLTYGGGIPHFDILCVHPVHMHDYINLGIFAHNGMVCTAHYRSTIDSWFAHRCQTLARRLKDADRSYQKPEFEEQENPEPDCDDLWGRNLPLFIFLSCYSNKPFAIYCNIAHNQLMHDTRAFEDPDASKKQKHPFIRGILEFGANVAKTYWSVTQQDVCIPMRRTTESYISKCPSHPC